MQERNYDPAQPPVPGPGQPPPPVGPPAYYPMPPVPQQHRTVRRQTAVLIGAGALVLGLAIGGAAENGGKKNATTAAGSPAAATTTVTTGAHSSAPAAAPAAVTVTVTAKPSAPAAAPTATAPASAVVLTTSGNGMKQTKSFTTGPDWAVTYTFDCSSFGSTGNFIVDEGNGNSIANSLAAKGGDTSYQHGDPGQHYLSVDSECDWTLKVVDGATG